MDYKKLIASHESKDVIGDIACISRACGCNVSPLANTFAAYLLSKAEAINSFETSTIQSIAESSLIKAEIVHEIYSLISEECWKSLKPLTEKYSAHDFEAAVLAEETSGYCADGDDFCTPDSIIQLSKELLAIEEADTVADICCGAGTFLIDTYNAQPRAKYYGYDINRTCIALAKIRSEILGNIMDIRQCDAFSLVANSRYLVPANGFSKLFSNFPFGLRLKQLQPTSGLDYLTKKYPSVSVSNSSEWYYVALMAELISKTGKAVVVVPSGATFTHINLELKKRLITDGLIEAVIALPNRMFDSTSVGTSIIVLSHGNDTVRLVDASRRFTVGRRQNTFSAKQINEIVTAYKGNDTDNSSTVTISEIMENGCSLCPSHYLTHEIAYENGVEFGSIIANISRGAQCSAQELDEIMTTESTGIQFLRLADIQDGIIGNDLPSLKSLDERNQRYCLQNGDLIISKIGFPYKIAVVELEEGQTILANGNLYIIRLDSHRALPYYIKAYLESSEGSSQLKKYTSGTAIQTIGVDKLKQVVIPLPSIDEQQQIVEKYLAAVDEVKIQRIKLSRSIERLSNLYDNLRGGN